MSTEPRQSVALSGRQTIADIESTRTLLAEHLAGTGPVEVACDAVAEADVTLIQVLLALRLSLSRQGRGLRLTGVAAGGMAPLLAAAGFDPAAQNGFWQGETQP